MGLFSDSSYLSAILDRQGLSVARPVDLVTKNTESFSPKLLQGFWSSNKEKNPKIVVMSPPVTTQNSKQKEVIWQQYCLCLAVAEYQILGGNILYFGTRIRKDLVVKNRYNTNRRSTTAAGHSCVARNASGFFIIWAISYVLLDWCRSNGMASTSSSWRLYVQSKRLFQFKRHSIGNMR